MQAPQDPRRLAATIEQAPIATELVGLGGELIAVNAAFCELTGYERERLLGTPSARLTHPDQALREGDLRA